MARLNEHYAKLVAGYLFPEISRRVAVYAEANPAADIIRLGIGDVVLPLAGTVADAIKSAADEMTTADGFHGYGPEQGYEFLREAIAAGDFASRGLDVVAEEIYVSDGSKCDSGNIQEIFSVEAIVAVPDPVYPVYVDTNVMAGRTGPAASDGRYEGIVYLPATEDNGFVSEPPDRAVDIVYLCFPNNPTGSVATHEQLRRWVDYARSNGSVILFDAAYEAYIRDPALPRSIFEIDGAREVAIEFRSFSKSAGFTGLRCGYVVVPRQLEAETPGGKVPVAGLWNRRHTTKFNGASYPVQRGAEAVYGERGRRELGERIDYYMDNAVIIREGLTALGLTVYGGTNAPYAWIKTPGGMGSWEFFDRMLEQAQVVGTPGAGFGACGEGFFRLSAFGRREQVSEAIERMRASLS